MYGFADMENYQAKILVISCRFGWGYCGDKEHLTAQLGDWRSVDCAGSIEVEQLLGPFAIGFDGVLILACPRGECHFQDGEWQCLKRVELLRGMLAVQGIAPERLAIQFGNDPSGAGIADIVSDFAERLKTV